MDPIDFVGAPARDPVPVLGPDEAVELLRAARRIAIVGASIHEWRASHSVMEYLLEQGYECAPITPMASEILGRTCHPTLEAAVAAGGPFDIVDVFRRPEHTPDIARSAVALGCGALWLQMRIVSWEAARIAHEGGLKVVMDRCTAVDHRRLREIREQQSGR
jgi:predicted CoA-binding protein